MVRRIQQYKFYLNRSDIDEDNRKLTLFCYRFFSLRLFHYCRQPAGLSALLPTPVPFGGSAPLFTVACSLQSTANSASFDASGTHSQ